VTPDLDTSMPRSYTCNELPDLHASTWNTNTRLLHAKDLYLKDFTGNTPAYTVLSKLGLMAKGLVLGFSHLLPKNVKESTKYTGCDDVAIRHVCDWVWNTRRPYDSKQ